MSEFKSLKSEEEKEQTEIINTFGRESLIIECRFCSKKVLTEIETETTWFGILLSIVLLLMFKLLSIPLIILIIPLTQLTLHRCPSCLNKVGTCNFYDLLSMSDKIITFSIGSFAVILSRKLLMGFFICLLMIIICVYFFSNIVISERSFIKDSWDDFIQKCSKEEFHKNGMQTKIYCQKYQYADVSWNGYVVRVDFDNSFITKYKVSIYVKMDISNNSEDGDIYLKIDDYNYNKMKNDIYNLIRGDHIYFNATVVSEGNERYPLIAEPFELAKKDGKINITSHIHHHGRYSMDVNNHSDKHKHIKTNETVYSELNEFVADKEVDTDLQKESYH